MTNERRKKSTIWLRSNEKKPVLPCYPIAFMGVEGFCLHKTGELEGFSGHGWVVSHILCGTPVVCRTGKTRKEAVEIAEKYVNGRLSAPDKAREFIQNGIDGTMRRLRRQMKEDDFTELMRSGTLTDEQIALLVACRLTAGAL